MRFTHSIFIVVGLSLFTLNAFAQSSLEGFSTGRYEIRSSKKSRTPASEEVTTTTSVSAPATVVTVVEKSVENSGLPKRSTKLIYPFFLPIFLRGFSCLFVAKLLRLLPALRASW